MPDGTSASPRPLAVRLMRQVISRLLSDAGSVPVRCRQHCVPPAGSAAFALATTSRGWTAAAAGRSRARFRLVTEDDAPLFQIIGGHLNAHTIAGDRLDAIAFHAPGRICDNLVAVIEGDTESAIRQNIRHRAFKFEEFFLSQLPSVADWFRLMGRRRGRPPFDIAGNQRWCLMRRRRSYSLRRFVAADLPWRSCSMS